MLPKIRTPPASGRKRPFISTPLDGAVMLVNDAMPTEFEEVVQNRPPSGEIAMPRTWALGDIVVAPPLVPYRVTVTPPFDPTHHTDPFKLVAYRSSRPNVVLVVVSTMPFAPSLAIVYGPTVEVAPVVPGAML